MNRKQAVNVVITSGISRESFVDIVTSKLDISPMELNMGLQDAADLLVQTDSLLYNKAHFGPIKQRLMERGFAVSLAISEQQVLRDAIRLVNTQEFANGVGNISILQNESAPIKLSVYSINGAFIKETEWLTQPELNPAEFAAGIYLIKVQSKTSAYTEKVMKLN